MKKRIGGRKVQKAQISIFVIIAIVLVAAGIGSFYFVKKSNQTQENKDFFSGNEIKPEMDSLQSSLITCLDDTTKDSLEMIGIQGGFNKKPEKALDLGWTFIPYYYEQGNFLMPDKFTVEKEISDSINENIVSCIDKIKISDIELKYSKPKTKTTIDKGKVSFIVDMPISVSKQGNSIIVQFKDLLVSYNSSLYDILEVAKYIIDSNKKDDRMMCISCIGKMAIEKKLYVNFIDISRYNTLVIISENYTSSTPYSFEFLNKYKQRELLVLKDSGVAPLAPVNLGGGE